MKERLTTLERRAKAACEEIAAYGGGHFYVVWGKSHMWGWCPRVEYQGEKVAYASGCGYDKHSAALADFLRFLVPDVRFASGVGESEMKRVMEAHGWVLEGGYDGRHVEEWAIRWGVPEFEGGLFDPRVP